MENRFPLPQTPFKTPEEEMQHLQKIIFEKEKALEQLGMKDEENAHSRSVIAEYKTIPEGKLVHTDLSLGRTEVERIALKLSPEEHDKQIEELVTIAREKGIKNALSILERMNSFHLTDDFHRFLAEYLKEGFSVAGFNPKEKLAKSLGMALYEVLIPEEPGENGEKGSLKEIISGMEQFYAGMLSVSSKDSPDNWISLEIANANFSEEVVFYVAVPQAAKNLFEKQILSIFPNAKIAEKPDDYNIFNKTGQTAGSIALSLKKPIFPIKTYEYFDHDPLNVIINSFSKVNKEGEGAAIQLVWSPVGEKYLKAYKDALTKIQKGTPVKEAIDIPDSLSADFAKTVKEILFAKSDKEKKENENKKNEGADDAITEIKKKIESPIVNCNLRLLASSGTKAEAEEILGSIESSFNQFQNTSGNSIKWKRLEKSELRAMVKNFAFRIFEQRENFPLSLREVTTLVHFHTKALGDSNILRQIRSNTAPAPFDMPPNGMLLGINKHRNTNSEVRISPEDRLRHFYCIGQTGTGKSTLLKNMIIQDIQNGEGVCMIDPHGSDIQEVLANIPEERFKDVLYFDPAYTERPMALNMLEYDQKFPEQKTFVVNELFSIFKKLYGSVPEAMGPAFEQYFRNSALLVMEDPSSGNTLVDVSRVLSDKTYRELKLSRCKNPLVSQFWRNAEKTTGDQGLANYVQYVTNKFDVFLANEIMRPVVAQEQSSFNLREVMDNKKILLVNLSKGRLGDINANLIGLILVGKMLMAALSRADSFGPSAGGLPPFYLYIDEFQNITTDSIATILSEARKYKLSLNIAHQFIAQLQEGTRDAVFGNVGSISSFRVGAEDAEYLEKQFGPTFSASDLMNIDNYNAYLKILVNGKPAKPFNVEILPPNKGDISKIEIIKNISYQKYGRPREEVEKLIQEKYAH